MESVSYLTFTAHPRILSPQYQKQTGTGTNTTQTEPRILVVQATPRARTICLANSGNTAPNTLRMAPFTPIALLAMPV